jgi:hypothetical protein
MNVRSDDELLKLSWKLLQQMYAASEPPLDLAKFRKDVNSKKIKCPKRWYLKHTITSAMYNEIAARFKKKHHITTYEYHKISWILLDYAPRCIDGE